MPIHPFRVHLEQVQAEVESGGSAASGADILAFIDSVRPVATDCELIRVGGDGDGGYLMPDVLGEISACFSPGVGPTSAFELHLATLGVRSFLADFSVEKPASDHPLFSFEKKFLSDVNDDMSVRLEDWVGRSVGLDRNDLLLQMDIEGAEYRVLLDTPASVLQRFKAICVEFHALENLLLPEALPFYRQAFDKLTADFWVLHIHPNNHISSARRGAIEIPGVLEFTFLRKDLARLVDRGLTFPHPLDVPNAPGSPGSGAFAEMLVAGRWR